MDYTDLKSIWEWRKDNGQIFVFNNLIKNGGIKFVLSQDEMNIIDDFAEKSYKTSLDCYANRQQNNPEVIRTQIIVGKRIEWCVSKFLNNRCVQCPPPDFRIFNADEKTYDFDFITNLFNVHVKGQNINSAINYGLSWTFGFKKGNKTDTDYHIFNPNKSRDIIFLGVNDGNECILLTGCFVSTLHDKNLF